MSERVPSVQIIGLPEFKARLAKLADAVAEAALVRGGMAGTKIIENSAKEKAPWRTRTLARSIHSEVKSSSRDRVEIDTGPDDLPYAAMQEFGGTIRPKTAKALRFEINGQIVFAQVVHIPAHPYMRPAMDENITEVTEEIRAALEQLIEAALR